MRHFKKDYKIENPDKAWDNDKTYIRVTSFKKKNHCAGLIPAYNIGLNTLYPDVLLPIGDDFTLIERAVLELVVLGVDSIWIVAPDESIAAIRAIVGENIIDPFSMLWLQRQEELDYSHKSIAKRNEFIRKRVRVTPVYFIPLHPADRGSKITNRDYPLWYIAYGIYVMNHVLRRVSNWITPVCYQIAFPYGIYPMSTYFHRDRRDLLNLRAFVHRMGSNDIGRAVQLFSFKHEESHITNGSPMGFMMDDYVYEALRQYVLKVGYNITPEAIEEVRQKLNVIVPRPAIRYRKKTPRAVIEGKKIKNLVPDEEIARTDKYGRRTIQMKEFFQNYAKIFNAGESQIEEVQHYHEINNWADYQTYLAWVESHKHENDMMEFYDVKPKFMTYVKLGRIGWAGVGHDLEHQEWEKAFKDLFTDMVHGDQE